MPGVKRADAFGMIYQNVIASIYRNFRYNSYGVRMYVSSPISGGIVVSDDSFVCETQIPAHLPIAFVYYSSVCNDPCPSDQPLLIDTYFSSQHCCHLDFHILTESSSILTCLDWHQTICFGIWSQEIWPLTLDSARFASHDMSPGIFAIRPLLERVLCVLSSR